MADTKQKAPHKYESLPEVFDAKRLINGNEQHYPFLKAKLRKIDKEAADRFALVPKRPTTDDEKVQLQQFGGLEIVSDLFLRGARNLSTRWTINSFAGDTGLFVPEEFAKCVDTWSARGETIKALKAEQLELIDELTEIQQDRQMSVDIKMKRFNEIMERMVAIKEAIEFKQATNAEADEAAEEVPTS